MKIHDISVPLSSEMPVYPGDPEVRIEPALEISRGDPANVCRLTFSDHTGTHVDPPVHFIPSGRSIDELDLQILYGPARVIDLTHLAQRIAPEDLELANLRSSDIRILCKTRNSLLWGRPDFQKDYVGIGWDAAQWLVKHGIKLVGIDYLSVEEFEASEPYTHRTLLGAGVVIVEGLNLREVAAGSYTLSCLPLRIRRGSGGPCRAILIEG